MKTLTSISKQFDRICFQTSIMARILASEAARRKGMDENGGGQKGGRGGQSGGRGGGVGKEE